VNPKPKEISMLGNLFTRTRKLLWDGGWVDQLSATGKLRLYLYLLFAFGAVLILVTEGFSHFVAELGITFVIAALLGLTVDSALKTELVRDVFEAAFNYVLPGELKEEVARVINYRFLCKIHSVVVEVTEIDDDLVNVTMSFERHIYNITSDPQVFNPFVDIDEWGIQGHPSDLDYYKVEIGQTIFNAKREQDGPGGKLVFRVQDHITVPRNEVVKITGKYHETRHRNDQISLGLGNPTINPTINVKLPKGFAHTCSFGIPGEIIVASGIEARYQLKGTQFPGQDTKIRWWPTSRPSIASE
jgi:hypothetical protein